MSAERASNLGGSVAVSPIELDVPTNDMGPLEHIWPYPPTAARPINVRALCGVTTYESDEGEATGPLGTETRLCGICRERARAMGVRI